MFLYILKSALIPTVPEGQGYPHSPPLLDPALLFVCGYYVLRQNTGLGLKFQKAQKQLPFSRPLSQYVYVCVCVYVYKFCLLGPGRPISYVPVYGNVAGHRVRMCFGVVGGGGESSPYC